MSTTTFDGLGIKDLAVMLRSGVTPVVASYGMGVDSTAFLLRYMLEPECRDFDLQDLIVITAQTGDEWERTGADVEAYMLPLFRAHGIRYVQVARGVLNPNQRTGDGIVVLDDSTAPTKVYLDGAYKLSDEMFENGTIPQLGGARKCSMHAKGWALDPTIAHLTGGRKFRHLIGFEANEMSRVPKDAKANSATRTGEYPLIAWGWDRAKCEAYIEEKLGVPWAKSACSFCPFACSNKTSRVVVFQRYQDEGPDRGAQTLLMEHCALAFNTNQGLLGKTHLVDLVAKAGYQDQVDRLNAALDAQPTWALYEVRRITIPKARSIKRLATGSRAEMEEALLNHAIETGADLEVGPTDGIPRAWLRRREDRPATIEHFFVVAPALAKDKERPNFPTWWRKAVIAAANRAKVAAYRARLAASDQALAS